MSDAQQQEFEELDLDPALKLAGEDLNVLAAEWWVPAMRRVANAAGWDVAEITARAGSELLPPHVQEEYPVGTPLTAVTLWPRRGGRGGQRVAGRGGWSGGDPVGAIGEDPAQVWTLALAAAVWREA